MPTDTREATPRPWKYIDCTKEASMQYVPKWVIKAGCKKIASSSWHSNSPYFPTMAESRANAALIVRAVNHFDEAVEVLRLVAGYGDFSRDVYFPNEPSAQDRARALLSKLEASHGI